jgi:cation:H+ antiporter
MNLLWAIVFLPLGLLILIKSADILVDAAVALAERLGISPFVVGLTIVAMGTSAPEVAASISASAKHMGAMALGNVYGSNIANLALIGGSCAIITPLAVSKSILRKELPMMLITALLLWPLLANLQLSRPEAALLLTLFAILLTFTVYSSISTRFQPVIPLTATPENIKSKVEKLKASLPLTIFFLLLGLVGLAIGAEITVRSAIVIGQKMGLSQAVIGLTIIAIGTSLPELVTCLAATIKKQADISVGNLVGSNIFNTLLVTGCAALVKPFNLDPRLIGIDYWFMIIISVLFLALALPAKKITKFSGLFLVTAYLGYIIYLLIFTRTT